MITYIWVYLGVPETRGVALGKEMDAVFGIDGTQDEEQIEEDEMEESERTALLRGQERARRGSLGVYT